MRNTIPQLASPVILRPDQRRVRARLLARIARRHRIIHEHIQIGPLRLPFARIENPDSVLDQIVEQEDRREKLTGVRLCGDELHLPYWAELWDSSFGVGEFLTALASRTPFKLIHALDLGCGMGLAGLTAAALGARVTLVDLEPDALLVARLNTLPYAHRVEIRRFDWRRDRLQDRFDLILGADVLYERAQWEYLEPFWQRHLKEEGAILLGEPGRQTGDLFPQWIRDHGWLLERFDQPVPTRQRPIRIFVLRSQAGRRCLG